MKMILWRRSSIIGLVSSFFIVVLLVNVYFVHTIVEERSTFEEQSRHKVILKKSPQVIKHGVVNNKVPDSLRSKGKKRFYLADEENQPIATKKALHKIRNIIQEIVPLYRNVSKDQNFVVEKVMKDLQQKMDVSSKMGEITEKWVTRSQVLPENAPLLGSVLNSLCSSRIVKADVSKKGTQLKLLFTLEGGQQALFKPQWYQRNKTVSGPVYAGKDRHNAEVAAFHLSLLLNLRRVPLTVGRKVNLRREVMPVATPELLNTFYQEGNNTCFYGVCLYCDAKNPVCAKGDLMEGALILWLPQKIRFDRHRHPWRRSYRDDVVARWEVEENYCLELKNEKHPEAESSSRLLDLTDAAVFDFLLDNGDRHHFELPSGLEPSTVFLLDNGKGFGNPQVDHLDILAPLYQCCLLKRKTWERLKMFAGGSLGPSLEKTLKYSHISPVLTDSHLNALDRRLLFVFAAVEICIRENGLTKVLL